MSTLKRALSSDAQDAQPSKKLAKDTASCVAQDDHGVAQEDQSLLQLDAMLRVHVFPFLSTRDTSAPELLKDHFGKVCGSNWFHLEPTRYPSGEVPSDDCDHDESDESESDDDEAEEEEEEEEESDGEGNDVEVEGEESSDAEAEEEDGESGNEDDGQDDEKSAEGDEDEVTEVGDGEEEGSDTGDGEDEEEGGESEDSDDDDEDESSSDEEGDDDDDEADRPQANAQLLSLIAAFEHFVVRATLPEDICITSYADNVFPVPVAVSLWDHHPRKQRSRGGHKWTRKDVRRALNGALDDLGDLFTATDPDAVHATEVGAHWESIELSAASGAAKCLLCEKATYLQAAFDATKDGDHAALTALQASAAGQTYAHCERAIAHHASPDFDESDTPFEALLESDDVSILASPLNHFDLSTVATAVDESYSVPDVCRSFVQPLKQFLLQYCQFVHRIEFPMPSGYDLRRWHGGSGETSAELLAGVILSGYLCGAFLTRVQS